MPRLRSLAGDPSDEVRQSAAQALYYVGLDRDAAVQLLVALLVSPEPESRRRAAEMSGVTGHGAHGALPMLRTVAAKDLEPAVRDTAAEAIAAIEH